MTSIDLSLFDENSLKIVKKGSYIMKQGDVPKYMYYLKKGICYTSSVSKDGLENIYWYFQEGDFPCISPTLTGEPSPLNIAAKTDCHLYPITQEQYHVLFRTNPDFAESISKVLLKQMNSMIIQHQVTLDFNTPSRVCYGLLQLATQKTINDQDIYTIDKSFSQLEISKYVGVHHVTLSLICKKLRELGIIEKKSGSIHIVDKPRLEHYTFVEELAYKECRS